MRTLTCLVFFALVSFCGVGQERKSQTPKRISPAEAKDHYQETVVVTGQVAQVTIREKLVYLNLDKKYPNTLLTGVIFAKATNQFGDLNKLEGKRVEITGTIDEYRDKLQIVLSSTNQLKVLEADK